MIDEGGVGHCQAMTATGTRQYYADRLTGINGLAPDVALGARWKGQLELLLRIDSVVCLHREDRLAQSLVTLSSSTRQERISNHLS